MKPWTETSVGDICTLNNGRAYKQKELLERGPIPVLRVGNFFSNRSWYYSDLELEASKYCDNGDLLYAWSASFGPRIWDGGKVIYHYHIWRVDNDPAKVDKRFLYHWFNWDVGRLRSEQGTGATMIHITKTAMEQRRLKLPPLSEQKRIADILDKADGIRRKRQEAITETNLFLRSAFLEMFGDPANPATKTQPLAEVASIVMGTSPPGKTYNENGDGEPLINGPVEFGKDHPVELQWTTKPIKMSEAGDILFCVRGATAGKLNWSNKPYCIGRGVAAIRSQSEDRNQDRFLFLCLELGYDYFQRIGTGSTFININRSVLESFQIPIASESQITRIREIATKLDQAKEKADLASRETDNLFNSLVQRAFKGEL